MKQINIVLAFLLILSSKSSAQWVQQTVPDSVTILNTVNFTHTNIGVSTGWDFTSSSVTTGRALYSTNAGANWLSGNVPFQCRVIASAEYIHASMLYGTGALNNSFDASMPQPDISHLDFMGRIKPEYKNIYTGNNTRGAFFKSTDGGMNWLQFGTLPSGCTYLTYMDFISANNGVVIADPGPYGTNFVNIYKTTNGGLSWTAQLPPDTKGNLEDIEYVSENLIFAVGYQIIDSVPRNIILKSTNGGTNWTTQFTGTTFYSKIHFVDSQTGFLTGVTEPIGKIFKTTDQGNTWNTIFTADSILFQGVNFFGQTGVGITFGNRNSKSGFYYPFAFRTSNFGATWSTQQLSTVNDPLLISSYLLDRYNYYISGGGFTSGAIYHTINGGSVGIGENPLTVADKFSLSQNYPNPFNPSTTIKYNVPDRSQIILKVYNTNGKEIAELVNEIKSQGSYEMIFDATNLPSGIYYYKLISGEVSETKKMILIK